MGIAIAGLICTLVGALGGVWLGQSYENQRSMGLRLDASNASTAARLRDLYVRMAVVAAKSTGAAKYLLEHEEVMDAHRAVAARTAFSNELKEMVKDQQALLADSGELLKSDPTELIRRVSEGETRTESLLSRWALMDKAPGEEAFADFPERLAELKEASFEVGLVAGQIEIEPDAQFVKEKFGAFLKLTRRFMDLLLRDPEADRSSLSEVCASMVSEEEEMLAMIRDHLAKLDHPAVHQSRG